MGDGSEALKIARDYLQSSLNVRDENSYMEEYDFAYICCTNICDISIPNFCGKLAPLLLPNFGQFFAKFLTSLYGAPGIPRV